MSTAAREAAARAFVAALGEARPEALAPGGYRYGPGDPARPLVAFGSAAFAELGAALGEAGRFAALFGTAPEGGSGWAPEPLPGQAIESGAGALSPRTAYVLSYRLTIWSDGREDHFVEAAFDETGAPCPEALAWRDGDAVDWAPEPGAAWPAGGDPWGRAAIEREARRLAERHEAELQARLASVEARLAAYYEPALREALYLKPRRGETGDDLDDALEARRALKADWAMKRAAEAERHRLRVEIELVARLKLTRMVRERRLRLTDAQGRGLPLAVAEAPGEAPGWAGCARCGDRAPRALGLSSDGRALCGACAVDCGGCGGWAAPEALSACSVCGEARCASCLGACGDHAACKAHFHACGCCGLAFCPGCLTGCAACGPHAPPVAKAHAAEAACDRCGSACCRKHAPGPCGLCRKATCAGCRFDCPGCGESVCDHHGAACETCGQTQCQACRASAGPLARKGRGARPGGCRACAMLPYAFEAPAEWVAALPAIAREGAVAWRGMETAALRYVLGVYAGRAHVWILDRESALVGEAAIGPDDPRHALLLGP